MGSDINRLAPVDDNDVYDCLVKHMLNTFDESEQKRLFNIFKDTTFGDARSRSGVFDIKSTIHPAICTDRSMAIVNYSPGFEKLVKEVLPDEQVTNLSKGKMFYFHKDHSKSFLHMLCLHPFDKLTCSVERDKDAVEMSGGLRETLEKDGRINGVSVCVEIDSQVKYFEIYTTPQKALFGYQAILIDITTRVKNEGGARLKNMWIYFLQHELRQSFNIIDSAKRRVQRISKKRSVDIIKKEAESAAQSLNSALSSILDSLDIFPKSEDMVISEILIKPFIEEVVRCSESRACKKKKRLAVSIDENISEQHLIVGDNCILLGGIMNILTNALDHCKSSVHFEVCLNSDSRLLIIDIKDDGPGISEQRRKDFNRKEVFFIPRSEFGITDGIPLAKWAAKLSDGDLSFLKESGETFPRFSLKYKEVVDEQW